ncbi:MAG TPA: DUF433 domain-containing protein [Terriglobales bacterium]|nr:DUF433 domain-containing protein [Terriglobales bacterium]
MLELFTLTEAAAIAEVSPDSIRTAMEKKSVVPSHRQRVGKVVRHQFSAADTLLVKVLTEFPFALSKQDKESLARVLVSGQKRSGCWSLQASELIYQCGDMRVSVALKLIRSKISRNLATYRWGKRRITSHNDVLSGEPVFRGTRIPLDHVASLFRKGISEQEIAEDFPHLTSRDLEYARLASRFVDRPGRPRKRLVMQRGSRAA